MMNIQNLGSHESVGVNYIDGTYAELCEKFWFESIGYTFPILLSRDGFKCDPETKFQTVTS